MANLNAKDRTRSPRFPSYPLSDALEYAAGIYENVHRSPIDAATAFTLMGFSGRSGASATALGAVRQFGLIEGIGDNTRISDLGLRILEPESSQERNEALEVAFKEPDVFNAIFSRFDGRIPPADEPVRAFLIRELGFSKVGANDCLNSLRKTLDFITMIRGSSPPALIPEDEEENENTEENPSSANPSKLHQKPLVYRIPLTRECIAEISFQGPVSAGAINKLQAHIDLMQDIWADE